ncbi:hypothetical protein MSPP1_001127 [Malassezia sp. CBS 17886]|nr:hypothetical protein MSPP1_001127 [Malassezia sp. CBS 17886]
MSTASPSVPTSAPSQYGASSVQHTQAASAHAGGGPSMHGHAATGMGQASEAHVGGHASATGLYPEGVAQTPHHLASSFPGAQLTPMASQYAAYGVAQHPMYGGSYSSHGYPPYPNYMGHMSHYAHPPHYPASSSNPPYHNAVMNGMVPHGGYSPHATGHMPSHHTQATMPISMGTSSSVSPAGPGGAMASGGMVPASHYGAAPQYNAQLPLASRHRVTTTLWEDEGTLCFQVDVKGVCVARRHDNNMVNGTKLLNVCGMSRGKRDGILKNEKERIVVKVGAMHLKGVWIAFARGKQLAEQHGIADALYPLFEQNIQSFLYHPDNYPRTAAVMAAAQERHVQRHYANPGTPAGSGMKDAGGNGEMAAGVPMHAGLSSGHWSAQQPHDSGASDASFHYQYQQQQHHPHYQHHPTAGMAPSQTSGSGVFSSANAHYGGPQMMPQAMRSASSASLGMDRRVEHSPDTHAPHAQGAAPTLQGGAGMPQRRVSGMKRSADDYDQMSGDASQADSQGTPQTGTGATAAHVAASNGQTASDTFSAGNFAPQGFALEDSMKLSKRSKVSDTPQQSPSLPLHSTQNHGVQSVYSSDAQGETEGRGTAHNDE